MRQILCVIDFSESAAKVWEVAARIANACSARLIVLFPYRLIDSAHPGDAPSLKQKLEDEARRKFISLKETTTEAEELSVEFHPEIGFADDRINAYLKRNDIDMVIMGQQPCASFPGSNTFALHSLMNESRLPFVIVPAY